jgi:quercetin dioxygenase-like cupin family protein
MRNDDMSSTLEKTTIFFPEQVVHADDMPWYSPPGWKGVFLKDLIGENQTYGKFSYHLVRVQENCEVPLHSHDTQWEWNAILGGNGTFILNKKEISVSKGQTFVTPPGVSHIIRAGNRDIVLLAMFVPPLG